MKFQAAPGVIAHELQDDLVLYVPSKDAVHVLNETAAAVWWLCDGTRDQGQILAALHKLYAGADGTLAQEVAATLQNLQDLCLVQPA